MNPFPGERCWTAKPSNHPTRPPWAVQCSGAQVSCVAKRTGCYKCLVPSLPPTQLWMVESFQREPRRILEPHLIIQIHEALLRMAICFSTSAWEEQHRKVANCILYLTMASAGHIAMCFSRNIAIYSDGCKKVPRNASFAKNVLIPRQDQWQAVSSLWQRAWFNHKLQSNSWDILVKAWLKCL